MKTLAEFKRRLVPGLSVTVEFPGSTIHGNTETTTIPGRTIARRVYSVHPGRVTWEKEGQPGQPGSRLYWPRADCIRFPDSNMAEVSHEPGGKPFATYRFAD